MKKLTIPKVKPVGRIYLFKMWLNDNDIIYKIGLTNSDRATDRLMEVVSSFFNVFRYIPKTIMLRDRMCTTPKTTEKFLHDTYKDCNVKFQKKFSGYTEFFQIDDEEKLLALYEDIE